MKLAVVGSRTYEDLEWVDEVLDTVFSFTDLEIVSGGARGPDRQAQEWAERNGIKTHIFLPDWKNQGKAAGFIRNRDIVDTCHKLIAFWDGESKGTKWTIDFAEKEGKLWKVYY